jgi:hypothetical protein
MAIREEINIVKQFIEEECKNNVKVVYSEKNEWLLLKTADRNKTFGAVRFNKNSFASLYLDTKDNYNMLDLLRKDEEYKNMQADIQSRVLGNFIQNKIKFYNEDQIIYLLKLINKVMEDDSIHITKKVRSKKNNTPNNIEDNNNEGQVQAVGA